MRCEGAWEWVKGVGVDVTGYEFRVVWVLSVGCEIKGKKKEAAITTTLHVSPL